MDRNAIIAQLGIKAAGNGSRTAVIEALRKAAEKGMTSEQIAKTAGLSSSKGELGLRNTVASLVSHLRTKENCDVVKDDEKYLLIGMNGKDGWVPEPWVAGRISKK